MVKEILVFFLGAILVCILAVPVLAENAQPENGSTHSHSLIYAAE